MTSMISKINGNQINSKVKLLIMENYIVSDGLHY